MAHYNRAMEYGRQLDSLDSLIVYFNNANTVYLTAVIFFGLLTLTCIIIYYRLWFRQQKNRHLHIITCLMRTIHKLNAITTTNK